jgi:hypothetical protein
MARDNTKFIPFYSEVHPDVVDELYFRAQCAISDKRTAEQIEWMNSRTSWGSVTLLESDKKTIRAAINNPSLSLDNTPTVEGTFFRGIRGTFNNVSNIWNAGKNQITNFGSGIRSYDATDPEYLAKNYINTRSGRTPPAIQTINFSLADTSAGAQGLLNDAQVDILVPDIEFFINEFEQKWFRLGNKAIIEIGHSVRLDRRGNYGRFEGNLVNFNFEYQTDGSVRVVLYFKASTDLATIIPKTVPTTTKPKTKEPQTAAPTLSEYTPENTYHGFLRSFADAVFPADDQTNNNRCHIFPTNFIEDELFGIGNVINKKDTVVVAESRFRSLLINENKRQRNKAIKKALRKYDNEKSDDITTYDIFMAQINMDSPTTEVTDAETDGTKSGTKYYVSLGMLIKLVNANMFAVTNYKPAEGELAELDSLDQNNKTTLDRVFLSCAPEFSTSLYFEDLVSSDHEKVILPGTENFTSDTYYNPLDANEIKPEGAEEQPGAQLLAENKIIRLGNIDSITLPDGSETNDISRISFYTDIKSLPQKRRSLLRSTITQFLSDTESAEDSLATDSDSAVVGIPANILISLDELQKIEQEEITETRDDDGKIIGAEFDIDQFITKISNLIRKCTGNAVNLQITSKPSTDLPGFTEEFENTDLLILKDTVANVPEKAALTTKVTKIPMFVNSTITADSTVIGRTATATGYVRAGTVVRSFKIVGKIPNSLKSLNMVLSQTSGVPRDSLSHFLNYIQADTKSKRDAAQSEYSQAYKNNRKNLIESKINYADQPLQADSKANLQDALKRYVSTPKKNLSELFAFTSPPYPLDVEIEMDGCYGFRFGDVITVEGLPAQYRKFVFTITKIDHNLTGNDWSTKLTCLMRPRLTAEPSLTDELKSGTSNLFSKRSSE